MAKHPFGAPPARRFDIAPTPDQIAFFRENGFLAVERLTTDEELDWLAKVIGFIFDEREEAAPWKPIDRSGTREEGQGKLTQAFFPEVEFPDLLDTTYRHNGRRFAAALLGEEEAELGCWGHILRKEPGGRAATWHQDHGYWLPELEYRALGAWLPLHDVSVEMGAMQFIPGSHRNGLMPHSQTDLPVYQKLRVRDLPDTAKAVACPLKAGGATFHHMHTLHYTEPNATDRPRTAFAIEFQVTPELRATPSDMPWFEEHRAAAGRGPLAYFADGQRVLLE